MTLSDRILLCALPVFSAGVTGLYLGSQERCAPGSIDFQTSVVFAGIFTSWSAIFGRTLGKDAADERGYSQGSESSEYKKHVGTYIVATSAASIAAQTLGYYIGRYA